MAEKTTFIKIDRNIVNWRWIRDPNTVVVFLYLIVKANIEDHDFMNITVHRGEVATSYPNIAAALGLSIRNVRTAINHLKSTGEVTAKQYPKFSVFTILNYDMYQSKATGKVTGSRQSSDSQVTGNRQQSKKYKNIKNDKKKEINKESAAPPPLRGAACTESKVKILPWEQKKMDAEGWTYEEFLRWKNQ